MYLALHNWENQRLKLEGGKIADEHESVKLSQYRRDNRWLEMDSRTAKPSRRDNSLSYRTGVRAIQKCHNHNMLLLQTVYSCLMSVA